MSKQTKSEAVETPKRGRGRPASFPGVETTKFLTSVPADTRTLLGALATKRGQNLNQVIAAAIEQMARKAKISDVTAAEAIIEAANVEA